MVTREEGNRRLLALAKYLREEVKPERFDFDTWFDEYDCGTVACALGWGCMMPEFKPLGLRLHRTSSGGLLPGLFESPTSVSPFSIGVTAAVHFFCITDKAADYLFLGFEKGRPLNTAGWTKEFVAERIEQWVAAHPA